MSWVVFAQNGNLFGQWQTVPNKSVKVQAGMLRRGLGQLMYCARF